MADYDSGRAEEFEAIKRRDQANLVDFLVNDTELAFIFLETAQISDSPVHVQGLIKEAQKALASVRHFLERVEDPVQWDKVHKRADTLAHAISSFSK
jgi:hypothetical protein